MILTKEKSHNKGEPKKPRQPLLKSLGNCAVEDPQALAKDARRSGLWRKQGSNGLDCNEHAVWIYLSSPICWNIPSPSRSIFVTDSSRNPRPIKRSCKCTLRGGGELRPIYCYTIRSRVLSLAVVTLKPLAATSERAWPTIAFGGAPAFQQNEREKTMAEPIPLTIESRRETVTQSQQYLSV